LPQQCQSAVAIGLKMLVKSSYSGTRKDRMIDKRLPKAGKIAEMLPAAVGGR
jgi:hypothetical protein